MKLILRIILCSISLLFFLLEQCKANPDAKRLYDDLINGYNSMVRPVGNNSDRVVVKMKIKLSQLIDVNLKNQLMTTNVWLEQQWFDYKLKWDPEEYGDNFETHFCCLMLILKYQPIGGVSKLHVPSELIWLPDLVLYNNADGNYEITIMTKAILHSDGLVIWKPPAIYKSSCEIDVEYFPFDEQTCSMKFGTWSYSGYEIDLRHMSEKDGNPVVESGMDLSAFYLSVEWDIMAVPARRKEIFYTCCPQPYIDITFNITLRRKTLFYTVNLIIPCVAISFLSILVFYLPSDSGEKVSLSIMIMLSLVVFFLLLAEIIPSTSLTVPLLGKYLLFTMILITFSSVATIAILNVNFRSPSTHQMAPWVKRLFIEILPNFLCMERPRNDEDENERGYHEELYSCNFENQLIPRDNNRRLSIDSINSNEFSVAVHDHDAEIVPINAHYQIANEEFASETQDSPLEENLMQISPELKLLTTRIQFLSQHKKNLDKYGQVEENWKFVAMVLDRLFLWIFTISCISGAALIILRAPTLYNIKQPIDVLLSKLSY